MIDRPWGVDLPPFTRSTSKGASGGAHVLVVLVVLVVRVDGSARALDREWIATRARAMTTAEDDVDEDALLYGDVGAWATTRGADAGWNAAISTVFVR